MAAKRHDVTVDSLVEELDDAKAIARAQGKSGDMTAAIMGKARITGNIVDRKESGAPGDFANLSTIDEIISKVRKELGEEAAKTVLALLSRAPETETAEVEQQQPTVTHDGPETRQ